MKDIENKERLAYELGVLMFNIVSTHEKALTFNNDYDSLGNFNSILFNIGVIEKEELKAGFLAECENYSIPKEEAEKLFEETIEELD